MKRIDLIGVALGLALGIPMTIYNNPGNSMPGHVAYVIGVTLFCWLVVRFVGRFYKPS
jgi:hypothetical protein